MVKSMGRKDIITKEYMEDTEVFADVFNHMIYKGEKVIDPKNLKELDTANVIIPYGANGIPRLWLSRSSRSGWGEQDKNCKGERQPEGICQKYEDMVVNVIKENGYVAG